MTLLRRGRCSCTNTSFFLYKRHSAPSDLIVSNRTLIVSKRASLLLMSNHHAEEPLPVSTIFFLNRFMLIRYQPYILALVGTNDVPSHDQRIAIRIILAKRASHVLSYSTIASLKTSTAALEAILSPARTILPEILSIIFEYCVLIQKALPRPFSRKAPILLTQICSKWRQIAIESTPKVNDFWCLRSDPFI